MSAPAAPPRPPAHRRTGAGATARAALGAAALAMLGLAALAAGAASCLRGTAFSCERDDQCTGSTAGRCEQPLGYCSFPDSACTSGSRFGDQSGPYAGKCVGDEVGGDGGIDAPGGDGAIDALVGCPTTYMALPGVATHVYRGIPGSGSWTVQQDVCAREGGYLAEPGDASELGAINLLAGAIEIWVGVSDVATEGTFVTGRGAAATFLPWETLEPNDAPIGGGGGGGDCARSSATGTYADDRCSTLRRAVCECEP